ncbi:hypothetical protein B0A48_15456 [Cryoendolithus antarcticus]|uniref:Uncharacterized protein n=1 Tax=Cryoendolithus antarcticus TaxID=1507870 RepID=A0A1V8SIB7_9PEZI|nr:hypothetical protein B0A48_15456 [Cryoendolithus antarcticus]
MANPQAPARPSPNCSPFDNALHTAHKEHVTLKRKHRDVEAQLAADNEQGTLLLSGQSLQPSPDLSARVARLRAGLQAALNSTVVVGEGAADAAISGALLGVLMQRQAESVAKQEVGDDVSLIEGLRDDVVFFATQFELVRGELTRVNAMPKAFKIVHEELVGELKGARRLVEAKEKAMEVRDKELVLRRSEKFALDTALCNKNKEIHALNTEMNRLAAQLNPAQQQAPHSAPVPGSGSWQAGVRPYATANVFTSWSQSQHLRPTAPAYMPAGHSSSASSASPAQTSNQSMALELQRVRTEAGKTRSALTQANTALAQTNASLTRTQAALTARSTDFTNLQKSLAAKNEYIRGLEAKNEGLMALEPKLAELEVKATAQSKALCSLSDKNVALEKDIKKKDGYLKDDKSVIADLDKEIATARGRLARRNKELDKQQLTIEDLEGKLAERERYIASCDAADHGHETCLADTKFYKAEVASLKEKLTATKNSTDHASCLADVKKCTDEIASLKEQLMSNDTEEVQRTLPIAHCDNQDTHYERCEVKATRFTDRIATLEEQLAAAEENGDHQVCLDDREEARAARDEASLNLYDMRTRWDEKEALLLSLREELAAATMVLEGMAVERPQTNRVSSPALMIKAEPVGLNQSTTVHLSQAEEHETNEDEDANSTNGSSTADTGSTGDLSRAETQETLDTSTSDKSASQSPAGAQALKRSEPSSEVYLPPQKRAYGADGADDAS